MPRCNYVVNVVVFWLVSCSFSVSFATTYYVSNSGNDQNDGCSPTRPWATLNRVNKASLEPGDSVLFKRGNVWRDQLIPKSGAPGKPITYGAYGKGPKPLLLGSVNKSRPQDWWTLKKADDIWIARGFKNDVGNIIFDGGKLCGVKVWQENDLKKEGQYWFDLKHKLVKLKMAENPARRFKQIECAVREHIILLSGCQHVVCENLAAMYGAAHGVGGRGDYIVIRDCDFGFIGGGDQYTNGKQTVRFGNGIEFWGSAHDCLVERCRLWEIYDAALTNQSLGPNVKQHNITYRNNIIWNCEYSFEYWNRPENSETKNIQFVNNTCVDAGKGWGHSQRPDPSGCHLRFYSNTARTSKIVIKGNIFYRSTSFAFFAPEWTREHIDELDMDQNCWYQESGMLIALPGKQYKMEEFAKYQADWKKEPGSFCADPKFVDCEKRDFRLLPDSPCRGKNPENNPSQNIGAL